jgi:hypothetical protein
MEVHRCSPKQSITRTREFEKKSLAQCASNVGTCCGHQCTYCSNLSLMRMQNSFKEVGNNLFAGCVFSCIPTVLRRRIWLR